MVATERTGTPAELSRKLAISVRTVYNYLNFMKTEMNAPIVYCNSKCSYYYDGECGFCFEGLKIKD